MSIFTEFHKAWTARFPGHELPGAWEEDVRANLAKHRSKVALLKEEIEKEEFYVVYLEQLLEDVRRHKSTAGPGFDNQPDPVVTKGSHSNSSTPDASREERGQGEGRESSLVDNLGSPSCDSLVTQAINTAIERNDPLTTTNRSEPLSQPLNLPDQTVNGNATNCVTEAINTVIERTNPLNSPYTLSLQTFLPSNEPLKSGKQAVNANKTNDITKAINTAIERTPRTAPTTRLSLPPNELLQISHHHDQVFNGNTPQSSEQNIRPNSNSVKDLARKFGSPPVANNTKKTPLYNRSTSAPLVNDYNSDKSHYVTVIPVCGIDEIPSTNKKLVAPPTSPKKKYWHASSSLVDSDNFELSRDKDYQPSPDRNEHGQQRVSQVESKGNSPGSLFHQGALTPSSQEQSQILVVDRIIENIVTGAPDDDTEDGLDEPIYDTVAPDEESVDFAEFVFDRGDDFSETLQSATSSNEAAGVRLGPGSDASNSSVGLDMLSSASSVYPDYANADVFYEKDEAKRHGASVGKNAVSGDDSDGDSVGSIGRHAKLDRTHLRSHDELLDIDSGVYGSSVESASYIPSLSPTPENFWPPKEDPDIESSDIRSSQIRPEDPKEGMLPRSPSEAERLTMCKCIISSILESENVYLECLNVVLQYMKALKATLTTSQPVISPDDFSTVFYRIPELHAAHETFLASLRARAAEWPSTSHVGDIFKTLANKLDVYAQFLQNYQRAVEAVRRCSSQSAQFADITRSMKLRSLQGQAQTLEDLLHRPVARVQKNALVLHDLLKYIPESHGDYECIKEALNLTQNFLTHFSILQNETMFPCPDRPQRHLVRNSFIVELVEGQRKLRHLFIFNDVLVCAKYKATGKAEKFTFEVKWYISLHDIVVQEESIYDTVQEQNPPDLIALKTQASTVRDQIRRDHFLNNEMKMASKTNLAREEKRRKKLFDLEAQLILSCPNLPLKIAKRNGPTHVFLLTSEHERDQWRETIKVLQSNTPGVGGSSLTLNDLQNWISACRSFLKTNMGSLILKPSVDSSKLLGDLHIVVTSLHGLTSVSKMFLCFEVDCYGHFFRKAKTKLAEGIEPNWNQDFIVELEGSHIMRILCYEETERDGVQLRGKAHLELSRSWLTSHLAEKRVSLQDLVLVMSLKLIPPETTIRGVPTGKPANLFGTPVIQICRREKRSVPFIVTRCVREVERRGLSEIGIYRVSGLASDINRLKKSFETNPYEAEQLVKEVDIHSVTGLLKLYLRELPEALFTDDLYQRFFDAYSAPDPEYKKNTLLRLFSSLPQLNQSLIVYLLEHLVKINQYESQNKMSLHNLATVFGPTLLKPAAKTKPLPEELLTDSTVNVMAQAGILHFFLNRRAIREPIQVV